MRSRGLSAQEGQHVVVRLESSFLPESIFSGSARAFLSKRWVTVPGPASHAAALGVSGASMFYSSTSTSSCVLLGNFRRRVPTARLLGAPSAPNVCFTTSSDRSNRGGSLGVPLAGFQLPQTSCGQCLMAHEPPGASMSMNGVFCARRVLSCQLGLMKCRSAHREREFSFSPTSVSKYEALH